MSFRATRTFYCILILLVGACRPSTPITLPSDAGVDDAVALMKGCGPGVPCRIKQRAIIDETLTFRNGAPSVHVSTDGLVSVLYARAFGDFDGFLAQKSLAEETFSSEKLPFALAMGVLIDTQPLSLIADDGTVDPAKHWVQVAPSQWEQKAGFGSQSRAHARSALVDSEGCIHFAGAPPPGNSTEGRYARQCGESTESASWAANMGVTNHVTLDRGVEADGVSMVYADFDDIEKQSLLKFVNIGKKPASEWTHERAAVYKGASDFYSPPQLAFASSAEGTHHLFFRRQSVSVPPGASEGLFEVTRSASGEWQQHALFSDEGQPFSCGVPRFSGEMCQYTSVEYVPLAAVNVPGAGVRLLVARRTQEAELEAVRPTGTPVLEWTGKLTQDGALWWVWRDMSNSEGTVRYLHEELASSGFDASRADATVDAQGDIHLVVYAQPKTETAEQNAGADANVTWVLIGK